MGDVNDVSHLIQSNTLLTALEDVSPFPSTSRQVSQQAQKLQAEHSEGYMLKSTWTFLRDSAFCV